MVKPVIIRVIIIIMKKANYITLQILLSLLLLVMGALIEWKGNNSIPGVAHMLLVVPGIVILFSIFIGKIKFAKYYYFIIAIAILTICLDLIIFLAYGLFVSKVSFYIGLIFADLSEIAICFLFNILYIRIK